MTGRKMTRGSIMGLRSSTRGRVGVANLCATCVAVGLLCYAGQWLFVAKDKAGRYLCTVVPSSTMTLQEYYVNRARFDVSMAQIDASGLEPCDKAVVAEVNRAQSFNYQSSKEAPTWIPRNEFDHAYVGHTDLQQVADTYAATCRNPDPDLRRWYSGSSWIQTYGYDRCPPQGLDLWRRFSDLFYPRR